MYTISKALSEDIAFRKALSVLHNHKSREMIFIKACEELNELSTKMLQWVNNTDKITNNDLMEEIVDVQMHLDLLQLIFHSSDLEGARLQKVNKFLTSKDFLKYQHDANITGKI